MLDGQRSSDEGGSQSGDAQSHRCRPAGDIADLLKLNGVSEDLLVLEITESAVISDPLRTEAVLARLARMVSGSRSTTSEPVTRR